MKLIEILNELRPKLGETGVNAVKEVLMKYASEFEDSKIIIESWEEIRRKHSNDNKYKITKEYTSDDIRVCDHCKKLCINPQIITDHNCEIYNYFRCEHCGNITFIKP